MSKHSPGPWIRSRLDPNCIGFINDVVEPGKQSNFHAVAQVRERLGETEGNRALIEQAPELLELLRIDAVLFARGFTRETAKALGLEMAFLKGGAHEMRRVITARRDAAIAEAEAQS